MKPDKITIHCADSKNGVSVSVDTIRSWHLARGFKDIGYHLVIDVDGSVGKGRSLMDDGAHVEGHNVGNVGICLVGKDRFTRQQYNALRYQLDSLKMIYDIKTWEIYCHYLFDSAIKQGKTCPNIPIQVILSWYIGHEEKSLIPYLL